MGEEKEDGSIFILSLEETDREKKNRPLFLPLSPVG
jgi:hypothetical protein